jgi:hypothetical protein
MRDAVWVHGCPAGGVAGAFLSIFENGQPQKKVCCAFFFAQNQGLIAGENFFAHFLEKVWFCPKNTFCHLWESTHSKRKKKKKRKQKAVSTETEQASGASFYFHCEFSWRVRKKGAKPC